MTAELERRIERLEQMLRTDGEAVVPREEASGAVGFDDDPNRRLNLLGWLEERRKPDETVSAIGVVRDAGTAVTVAAWGPDEQVGWDKDVLRRVAAVCGALASEVRLAILNELLRGPKSTAELIAAVSLDRGQLYHHLRDLFVQGFVEQPSRGTYAVTSRGAPMLLIAGHLGIIGPESHRESPELDLGDDGG